MACSSSVRCWALAVRRSAPGWRAQGVAFIDDPTNADTAFTRNRIRHELLPALEKAFPQFRDTFARSARHAAQAQELLAALAADDLAVVGDPPVIQALRKLSRPRQANVLRHWLRTAHQCAASAAQMEELLDQVDACATRGHDIRIKVGTGFVERTARVCASALAAYAPIIAASLRADGSRRARYIASFAQRVARIILLRSLTLPMALIVHKYGGTSMGSTERIRNVAKRVAKWASRRPPDGRGAQRHERRNQPPAGPGQGTGARPNRPTRSTASSTCWPRPASRPRRRCWPSRCRPKAWKP